MNKSDIESQILLKYSQMNQVDSELQQFSQSSDLIGQERADKIESFHQDYFSLHKDVLNLSAQYHSL